MRSANDQTAGNLRHWKKNLSAGRTIYLPWAGKHLQNYIQAQNTEESFVALVLFLLVSCLSLPDDLCLQ